MPMQPHAFSAGAGLLVGIDVGGTHTDAVAVRDGQVIAQVKELTDPDNLLHSVSGALDGLNLDSADISRVNLSTTLATNAVVNGTLEEVGVLVCGGPGIDPEMFRIGRHYYAVPGAIDFRGVEIEALDADRLAVVAAECRKKGLDAYAVVSKFSSRNPEQERRMGALCGQDGGAVSYGHKLSGRLNFPRRIVTAYYNAAVRKTHDAFATAVFNALAEAGARAPVHILKADGGTMPLGLSREMPVETILSGPSASVMGIMALAGVMSGFTRNDFAVLDIGGSTTDIALFANGSPVVERDGIAIGGRLSLVRALRTLSIGVGGDSRICRENGTIRLGARVGFSLAFGGREATLTDALNVLNRARAGDISASASGIAALALDWGMNAVDLASAAVEDAIQRIAGALAELVRAINALPVYTLKELLEDRPVAPARLCLAGGPAEALASLLETATGIPAYVPEHYAVANAVGAAFARTTAELELYADTAKGLLTIPTLNIRKNVGQDYSLDQAKADARAALAAACADLGVSAAGNDIAITEASSFNMIEGLRRSGRTLRVRAQIQPGLLQTLRS